MNKLLKIRRIFVTSKLFLSFFIEKLLVRNVPKSLVVTTEKSNFASESV